MSTCSRSDRVEHKEIARLCTSNVYIRPGVLLNRYMSQNSQPLREPSLLSRIGARVDDPPHHVSPSQGNPRSYHSNQREETGFTPLKNNSKGMWPRPPPGLAATTGHAGRHPQAKQHVSGSSFVDRVPDTPRTTAFSLGTATQDWNNHAYVISATVSTSGSPAGSDIKAMSVDEPLDSKQFRKQSSRMSVDPSPLTGTYRKASSRMSVDPPGLCAQRKTASPMSVDVPSTRRSRGSSDRMLIDEIQHHYPTQNLPQQAYSQYRPSFTTRPNVPPTRNTLAHLPRECTLASGALLATSFPLQHSSLSHNRDSARGEANLASMPSLRSSSLPHGWEKDNYDIVPELPPRLIPNSPAHPSGRSKSLPAGTPGTFSPKHGTPASRQGSRSPSTKPDIHRQSPTSNCVRSREPSSGDDTSYKHHCVRQDSQPNVLLSIDSRSACGPSPQSPKSLSPIDDSEAWLPPMEKQLEMAHKSQLKARFRKFTAFIGGAVKGIKQAIVPYHKDHRQRKVARTNTNWSPFSGVPDYLRSPKPKSKPRIQQRTSFDNEKDIDHIAQTWAGLTLCDSPKSLKGDDRSLP